MITLASGVCVLRSRIPGCVRHHRDGRAARPRRCRADRPRAVEHAAGAARGAAGRGHRGERRARDPVDAHPPRSRRRHRHPRRTRTLRCRSTCTRSARRTWSNPEKLIASATRLWGGEMDRLWGEFRPVPADRLVTLQRRRTDRCRRPRSRRGVHAGPRVAPRQLLQRRHRHRVRRRHRGHPARTGGFVLPPTPPPDIDLEIWRASLGQIGAWRPARCSSRTSVRSGRRPRISPRWPITCSSWPASQRHRSRRTDDEEREAWFTDEVRRELRRRMSEGDAKSYEIAGRFDLNWRGLARYWRKKTNADDASRRTATCCYAVARVSSDRRPPRIDHQAERQALRLRSGRRRDAVNGAEHAPVLQRTGQVVAVAYVAFELELHEAIQGNRHRGLTLHVDAEVAHVARDDGSKPGRAALVFPGEACRQRDARALAGPLVRVETLRRGRIRPGVLHRALQ